MITLYQFHPYWGLPNASPFCLKLETYLRMTHCPYEIVSIQDPRSFPKGKLPCIRDDGRLIADSGLIIDYLKEKYGDPLDAHLDEKQKATALAWQRLMEEHLYWVLVYSRWIEPENWVRVQKDFFGHIPSPVRFIVTRMLHKKVNRDLKGQGMSRHSREEIYQMGIKDVAALNTQLGEQDYFMGKKPSSIDACVYAYMANILHTPIVSPLQTYAKSHTVFNDYCTRMKNQFYS